MFFIGVRRSPERDISSLGAMGPGPGKFLGLFAYRVRFSEFFGAAGGEAAGGDATGWG